MKIESLHDLLVDELKDLHNAETQLVDAYPDLIKAASTPQLKQAFLEHLEQTKGHIRRLEGILTTLGQSSGRNRCVGMEGLIREAKDLMKDGSDPDVLDAGLIVAAQKVEHYEMAAYGSARAHAGTLGNTSAHRTLQETLNEEADADRRLSKIAEDLVNLEAAEPGEGDRDEEETEASTR